MGALEGMECDATLLEAHERRPDEEHFDLFLWVIDEVGVRTFVVFWPLGARLHGLEV